LYENCVSLKKIKNVFKSFVIIEIEIPTPLLKTFYNYAYQSLVHFKWTSELSALYGSFSTDSICLCVNRYRLDDALVQ